MAALRLKNGAIESHKLRLKKVGVESHTLRLRIGGKGAAALG